MINTTPNVVETNVPSIELKYFGTNKMRTKLDQINNAGSKGLIILAANNMRFVKRIKEIF